MVKEFAPVALFAYKRLDTLKVTIDSLRSNFLAKETDLYIFSDGSKGSNDFSAIIEIRNYLKTIEGFKSVRIIESVQNKGLADSIISGVSHILSFNDSVIVLEDDLITSKNFLNFMNDSLKFYAKNPKIFSITGCTSPIINNTPSDVYFTMRSRSTGWATWSDRWIRIDWTIEQFKIDRNRISFRLGFNKMGSDMFNLLNRQYKGESDSWAIRWCYHQYSYELYSVHPTVSKVENIGFGEGASNTVEKHNRFWTILDKENKINFIFPTEPSLDKFVTRQFTKVFSIRYRVYYKVLNLFHIVFGKR